MRRWDYDCKTYLVLPQNEKSEKLHNLLLKKYNNEAYFLIEKCPENFFEEHPFMKNKIGLNIWPNTTTCGVGRASMILLQRMRAEGDNYPEIKNREMISLKEDIKSVKKDLAEWFQLLNDLIIEQNIEYVGIVRSNNYFSDDPMKKYEDRLYGPNYICIDDLIPENNLWKKVLNGEQVEDDTANGYPFNALNPLYNLDPNTLLCVTASKEEIIKNCIWK